MSAGEPVKILMVDDQPSKLLSYEAILTNMGLDLLQANSGREALEQLLKHDVAVVLMDVSMPEIDGFELAAMIRQHPRYQKTAIIFVSAVRSSDLDRLKGYEVGAVDYIPVPVIPEILRAKVSVFAELYRKTRELELLNRDLERRVEERTAALEESMEREREARLAAEAAIQVRDDFLSIAAHELKTPLTGLRVSAQTSLRKLSKDGEEYPEWIASGLRTVDRQAERLTRLIEQLLDVSRLDQDKLVSEFVSTDLAELVERLVVLFQARTTRHALVLSAEPGIVADIDPLSIERVVANLLDNAVKYSPQGGQIDVDLSRADVGVGGAARARLSVRDRGIGIPLEMRDSIFERFYQAHADDHRSGLGLGLYISREIVGLHGGEIDAEFPPDGGTRFVVRLPCAARVEPLVASADGAAGRHTQLGHEVDA